MATHLHSLKGLCTRYGNEMGYRTIFHLKANCCNSPEIKLIDKGYRLKLSNPPIKDFFEVFKCMMCNAIEEKWYNV